MKRPILTTGNVLPVAQTGNNPLIAALSQQDVRTGSKRAADGHPASRVISTEELVR
jgi:hypothetical protein